MSRSGYVDEAEDGATNLWRGAVASAIKGKRGQAALAELLQALDAMQDKRLHPHSFATADGEFCALGVLGAKRGIKLHDLGDEDDCDLSKVAQRFGIAIALAAEIVYLNDEYFVNEWKWVKVEICGPMRPHYPDWGEHTRDMRVPNHDHASQRWQQMRAWVVKNLKAAEGGET